jgi:TRIAD3 protein (E3 ubiquitin-protein ligase RNF216)
MTFIDSCLNQSRSRLYPAYRILEAAQRTFNDQNPAYNRIKLTSRRRQPKEYLEANLEGFMNALRPHEDRVEILRELQGARRIRKKADAKHAEELRLKSEEEDNIKKAELEGTMSECGCCCDPFPLNRMVHCDNEDVLHWFCRHCAKRTAEEAIGQSKYDLGCMSMEGCTAGFSMEQR